MIKKLIRKMLTAAGGPLQLTPKELRYLEWSKMTPELKREYRTNRAETYLLSVPNITNFWEAFQTYIGNRDPENPHLQTGDVPTPGSLGVGLTVNIVKKTPSIIQAYKEIVPRFIKKVKKFNGANKILRTISATSKLISPTYTKTLAKSPELVDYIPLWGFKSFNTKLLQNFLKVWEAEAAKGPYSLKGLLQYDYSSDKIGNLPKHFEEARKLQRGIDLGGRYGRLVSRKYQQMYDLITDPNLKHIADTSPLYIPELFLLLKNFGGASEDFLKELIKRSNSYRRYMTKPGTAEDFKTFKGSGLIKGEGSQINVEGKMRSDFNGEYGSYPGYYEGLPNLKGDISTWWDQRIPLGVDVKLGIWTENPTIIKLRLKGYNYDNSGSSAIELEFWKNYTAPKKFIDWPTHLVFFGTKGSQLLNFNVTTEMPKNFIFGKGYKQGGKMNILEFLKNGSGIHIKKKNRGKFTSYCGGKVTDECILKGKNSSNPAIRKRATFALNARRWKHESGGLFPSLKVNKHQAFVPGASITDSNPKAYFLLKKKKGKKIDKSCNGLKIKFQQGGKNGSPAKKDSWLKRTWNNIEGIGKDIGDFLNSDVGKGMAGIGLNLLNGYMDYKKTSNLLDSQVESSKASLEKSYLDIMLEALQNKILRQLQLKLRWQLAYLNGETLDNYSDIVAQHVGWDLYSSALLNAEQLKRLQEALMDLQAKLAKSNALGNLFGSVVLSGLGVLGNVLGNKNSTTTQNLLNSSTIGKSTNPYMYTGLGANYNASTFFK